MTAMGEKTEQVGFRLPTALLKRVDAHAKRLRESTGMSVTRTDAVRELLTEALDRRAKK